MAYHLHIVLAHTQILLCKLWVFENSRCLMNRKQRSLMLAGSMFDDSTDYAKL